METTIICRLGWCESCFKEKRPRTNQKLLLFGATSNAFVASRAVHNGRAGFIPHLYQLRKVIEQKVFYQRVCCICGFYEEEQPDGKTFLVLDETQWSGWIKTSLSNWNKLVTFKDTGFEI